MGLIVPAVLTPSRTELEEKLALLECIPSVARIQIDVVDGKLATPASWPYTEPGALRMMQNAGKSLPRPEQFEYEIDLMCLDAGAVAGDWLALGASRLTFHIESLVSNPNLLRTMHQTYGSSGIGLDHLATFGVALNVETDPRIIEPYLADIAYVQCMGIAKIGKQGQPFDPRVVERVRAIRHRYPDLPIQVDGGVSLAHARELRAAGATDLIVGSAILRAADPAAAFAAFEALESPFGV